MDGTLLKFSFLKLQGKGHLISNGLFSVFNSPKKQTKNVCPSRIGQKFEFSSSFFGRVEDSERAFRNLLTFRGFQICGTMGLDAKDLNHKKFTSRSFEWGVKKIWIYQNLVFNVLKRWHFLMIFYFGSSEKACSYHEFSTRGNFQIGSCAQLLYICISRKVFSQLF